MREKLKNDLLVLLDKYSDTDTLRQIEPQIEIILSDYEIEERKTEIIPYGSDVPETVEIYIVTKKDCRIVGKNSISVSYSAEGLFPNSM